MNQDTNKQEKPLDPFFEKIKRQARQAGSNAKLRTLLTSVLDGKAIVLSADGNVATINLLPDQYVAICRLVGVEPNYRRTEDGQNSELCSRPTATGEPDFPVYEEGNEPSEDSKGADQLEPQG